MLDQPKTASKGQVMDIVILKGALSPVFCRFLQARVNSLPWDDKHSQLKVIIKNNLRSFPRNKIEHKIFVKLSQVVIYHGVSRNIK